MKYTIDTNGFKELDNLLKKLPKNIEDKVVRRSIVGAARSVMKDIKSSAPVGPPRPDVTTHRSDKAAKNYARKKKYGHLKDNIKARASFIGRKRGIISAAIHTGMAFWAYWREFGNSRQPARPWFVPAFNAGVSKALSELKERIGKGIEKEAKKLK